MNVTANSPARSDCAHCSEKPQKLQELHVKRYRPQLHSWQYNKKTEKVWLYCLFGTTKFAKKKFLLSKNNLSMRLENCIWTKHKTSRKMSFEQSRPMEIFGHIAAPHLKTKTKSKQTLHINVSTSYQLLSTAVENRWFGFFGSHRIWAPCSHWWWTPL